MLRASASGHGGPPVAVESQPTLASPALNSSQCSVMRPLIGLGGHQRRSPVKIKVLFSGAKITTSSSGRACWRAGSTSCVPLVCLWCACACLHQLLFSRRLGQDVWLQALRRLIRRPRPSASQAARRPPPRRRIYRERGRFIISGLVAPFLLLPLHGASSAVCALLVVSALLVSRCDAQPTDNEAVASSQRWPHPLDTPGVSFFGPFSCLLLHLNSIPLASSVKKAILEYCESLDTPFRV